MVKTKCDGISISKALVLLCGNGKWLMLYARLFFFLLFFVFYFSNKQPDKINRSIRLSEPENTLFVLFCFLRHFMSCNNRFFYKIHYSRYSMLFSVLKRTSFLTPNRHGYSVQFSPFDANVLAVGKSGKCAFTHLHSITKALFP